MIIMEITTRKYIGKILDIFNGREVEKVAIYSEEPNYYSNGDDYDIVGWLCTKNGRLKFYGMYYPARDIQDYFLQRLGTVQDKPVPVDITFTVKKK